MVSFLDTTKHYLTIKSLNTVLYEERKLDSNTKHCCIMP